MKVAIGAGHNVYVKGIFDQGASSGEYIEATITKNTVEELIPLLRAQGHEVLDVTPYNEYFHYKRHPHEVRAKKADDWGADIYLDIHINAFNKIANGVEAWIFSNTSPSKKYAKKIVDNIVNDIGLNNRGVKINPAYYTLYLPKTPSIIIEGGFIDNTSDMNKLNPKNYARAIAKSFGEVKEREKDKMLYRVRKSWEDSKSQKGAYIDINNAIELAKQIDFNVYDESGKQVYPEEVKKNHWAQKHYDGLINAGINIEETRFDDAITRGETFKLLDELVKKKMI